MNDNAPSLGVMCGQHVSSLSLCWLFRPKFTVAIQIPHDVGLELKILPRWVELNAVCLKPFVTVVELIYILSESAKV